MSSIQILVRVAHEQAHHYSLQEQLRIYRSIADVLPHESPLRARASEIARGLSQVDARLLEFGESAATI